MGQVREARDEVMDFRARLRWAVALHSIEEEVARDTVQYPAAGQT